MFTQPILRTATELRDWMEVLMRDTANERWSANEYLYTLNQVLYSWERRVRLPALYTLTDGFTAGTYEYDVPNFIKPPFIVEMRENVWGIELENEDGDETEYTWVRPPSYTLEPDGDGDQKLRLHGHTYSTDARIIYHASNGPVPITAPTLSADITATSTSLAVNSAVTVGDTGWVKVDDEWIQYSGVARASASVTLQNLERGIYETTAAAHTSGTTVYWGVAVDTDALWGQLRNQWESELHRMFLTDGSEGERRRHQEQIMYLKGQIEDFWRMHYTPQPVHRIALGQRVMRF